MEIATDDDAYEEEVAEKGGYHVDGEVRGIEMVHLRLSLHSVSLSRLSECQERTGEIVIY